MDSTDFVNSEHDLTSRMDAASLTDTPRAPPETPATMSRYTPFEPTRQVAKVRDETAEKIRMDFEEFIERFVITGLILFFLLSTLCQSV